MVAAAPVFLDNCQLRVHNAPHKTRRTALATIQVAE